MAGGERGSAKPLYYCRRYYLRFYYHVSVFVWTTHACRTPHGVKLHQVNEERDVIVYLFSRVHGI